MLDFSIPSIFKMQIKPSI